MKFESTIYANQYLIVDDLELVVGLRIVAGRQIEEYYIYDKVYVDTDSNGYICSSIRKPGWGQILKVRRDSSDYFLGVLMDTGEFGFLKRARIEKVIRNTR